MADQGAKRVFSLAAQTPFAASIYTMMADQLKPRGVELLGQIIYDASKTSFRTEIDQALKTKPDTLYLNSYAPDVTVLLRELYRAGFEGKKYTLAYAANPKVLASLPAEVTQGLVTMAPSPDVDSPAFKQVAAVVGADPDPYSCQAHDHIALATLAAAKAGDASGPAIRDTVRKIGNRDGVKVTDAVEGLKLLASGKEINYEGASGACKFTPIGDIEGCKFRFEVAEGGKSRVLSIS
jgi:branched-chain amino acid transport system substrate-binding protein